MCGYAWSRLVRKQSWAENHSHPDPEPWYGAFMYYYDVANLHNKKRERPFQKMVQAYRTSRFMVKKKMQKKLFLSTFTKGCRSCNSELTGICLSDFAHACVYFSNMFWKIQSTTNGAHLQGVPWSVSSGCMFYRHHDRSQHTVTTDVPGYLKPPFLAEERLHKLNFLHLPEIKLLS